MKNFPKIRQSLFSYLREKEIPFSWVVDHEMKDRAVAKFSFDLRTAPSILYGLYEDKAKEIISIAHEAGHVMTYQKMNRENMRLYLCAMLAANGVGLGRISHTAQECILNVEACSSLNGLSILEEIGVTHTDLDTSANVMAKWYATYEALCHLDVVIKVRDVILKTCDYNSIKARFRLSSLEIPCSCAACRADL
jgi:hypothetical protein